VNPTRFAKRREVSGVARYLLISAGLICVGLGAAGVFVPLLPTTPFLLLAAACFARSSDRFYHWLMTNRWLGSYIRNYVEHRATTFATKVASTTMLWCSLVFAGAFFTESWTVRALLLVVAVGVTIHLARLTVVRRETAREVLPERGAQKRIQLRQTALFYKVDADYGTRVAKGLGLDANEVKRLAAMSQADRVKATEK
jgi:uncharacterized membrane protein YbaN (DUF454 family)